MIRLILLMLAVLLAPLTAISQLAEAPVTPELSVTISPSEATATRSYIQAQLVVRIQLVSRYPFEELSVTPPSFENADVEQLVRPRTKKITGYAGQGFLFEMAFALTPRQSGAYQINPVTAVGMVSPEGADDLRFDLASDPVEINVDDVPATFGGDWWMATSRAEIDEKWSLPVEEIRVGEIAQRRVSLRVWGVSDERLPELEHPPAQGVAISLRSVKTRTETSSEGLIAYADYVWDLEVKQQQIIFIKPIGLTYWDPSEHRQKAVSAKGHRLEPLPADSENLADDLLREAAAAQDRTNTWAWVIGTILIVPLGALLAAFIFVSVPTRSDMHLWKACGKNATPDDIYNEVDRWLTSVELSADVAKKRLPAREDLAAHFFAPNHPAADSLGALRTQALRLSRQTRQVAFALRVRSVLTGSTPM